MREEQMTLRDVTIVIISTGFLWGCAGVSVRTIGNDAAADKAAKGFRYYQPSPYLLVFTDNKGGLTSQILYLPDPSKKMSARPFAVVADNETSLTFESGVLKQAVVDVDETVVPKAALDALKDVLSSAVKAAGAFNIANVTQTTAPAPSIFKIVVYEGNLMLIGNGSEPAVIMTSAKVAGGVE
jgi:hypothetical protein